MSDIKGNSTGNSTTVPNTLHEITAEKIAIEFLYYRAAAASDEVKNDTSRSTAYDNYLRVLASLCDESDPREAVTAAKSKYFKNAGILKKWEWRDIGTNDMFEEYVRSALPQWIARIEKYGKSNGEDFKNMVKKAQNFVYHFQKNHFSAQTNSSRNELLSYIKDYGYGKMKEYVGRDLNCGIAPLRSQ